MDLRDIYKKHKETAVNFSWRNLQMAGKSGVFLAIFFIAAKVMSPEEFGSLNYLMAVMALLVIFCDFGVSAATAKFTAEYNTLRPEKVSKVPASTCVMVIFVSTLVSLCVFAFGRSIFRENYKYAILFIPYLFTMPLSNVLDGFYSGLKKFKRLAVVHLASGIAALAASIFLIKNYGFTGAVLSFNALYLFLAVSLFASGGFSFGLDRTVLKDVSGYGFLIGLASVSYFMYSRVDMLILEQFDYTVEIGYYGIINKIFGIMIILSMILGQVIAPNITRYVSLRDYAAVKGKFLGHLRLILGLAVPFTLLVYMSFPILLKTLLPQYYTAVFLTVFKILVFLLPLKIWGAYAVHGFITPSGYVKIITVLTFIGGVFNIVFDYIFIYFMGFIGVFWVTLVIHSLTILTENLLFYGKIRPRAA